MSQLILRQEVLKDIRKKPSLLDEVGKVLNLSVRRLIDITYNNDPRLTQATVLRILEKELNKNQSQLLTELAAA